LSQISLAGHFYAAEISGLSSISDTHSMESWLVGKLFIAGHGGHIS
jgi:hypothetical protein